MAPQTLKDLVRDLLVKGELEEIAETAVGRRRVLGTLVSLTFDHDLEVAWRAVEAQGVAAERLSEKNPSYVKEHVRRLYWLITEESGGCLWRAPECMAECGARMPRLLKSFVPIAFHLIETLEEEDLEHFRPGALWAVGRLIEVARESLPGVLPLVLSALEDPVSQSRGMAVWCLTQVGEGKALGERPALLQDEGAVQLYRNRFLETTTVAALTQEALNGAVAEPA